MSFIHNIFSFFAIKIYSGICKAMIDSYNIVKKQNPDIPKREIYALALSMRPTWKREKPNSYAFIKGRKRLIIEESDSLKEVALKVILIENPPPNYNAESHLEIIAAVGTMFKDFKE